MNLLLDTHIALWAFQDDPRLSARARDLILDRKMLPHLSIVSLWEIAIKHALARNGRHDFAVSAAQALEAAETAGFTLVPVEVGHVLALETLPPHHADPFDRLLVATAVSGSFHLLTHDTRLEAYGATIILV